MTGFVVVGFREGAHVESGWTHPPTAEPSVTVWLNLSAAKAKADRLARSGRRGLRWAVLSADDWYGSAPSDMVPLHETP